MSFFKAFGCTCSLIKYRDAGSFACDRFIRRWPALLCQHFGEKTDLDRKKYPFPSPDTEIYKSRQLVILMRSRL